MDGPSRNLRQQALQKIAAISTNHASGQHEHTTFKSLFGALHRPQDSSTNAPLSTNGVGNGHSLADTPMTIEELDVLLALSKVASQLDNIRDAELLFNRISPYLLEAHEQAIVPSPFLQLVEPSPWEALGYNLVAAMLAIGIKHTSLHSRIYDCLVKYTDKCRVIAESARRSNIEAASGSIKTQKILGTVMLSMSLLGFLNATSTYFHFFSANERLVVVGLLRDLLSDSFLVSLEGALSSIRNSDSGSRVTKDFKFFSKRYASSGRPLGAMLLQQGLLRLLVSCSSLQVFPKETLQDISILEALMPMRHPQLAPRREVDTVLTETLADAAAEAMRLLEDGADYLELGSAWQQHLAFKVRGHALVIFLTCMIIDEEVADEDVLMSWLDNVMADPVQMANAELACIVLKCVAIVAKTSSAIASGLSRSLPRFIVQGGVQGHTAVVAAQCLASILKLLSQDAIITGLYSLGNVLSASSSENGITSTGLVNGSLGSKGSGRYTQHRNSSAISLGVSGEEETLLVYAVVVRAIVTIARECANEKITALAQSMLLQKLGRINISVDLHIIVEVAGLGTFASDYDLKMLLKLYDRLAHDATSQNNAHLLEAILVSRIKLAEDLPKDSTSFQVYLRHLLETIVSKGDVHESENTQKANTELAAKEIGQLLGPLASLAPSIAQYGSIVDDESTEPLQREVWFNIAVHGIIPGSALWEQYRTHLRTLAVYTKPLVAEDRTDHLESDIELNTVLRRGMNGPHIAEVKRSLIKFLPKEESNIRPLTYAKVIFLLAAYSLETLRAETGSCAPVLVYFADPSVNQGDTSQCMAAVADEAMSIFLTRTLNGLHADSTAPYVAKELAKVLAVCCHRIPKCQEIATTFANRLITQMPSSLCQRDSLFVLLELLTIMWLSCLDAEIEEYEWKSTYVSKLTAISLELSDDFSFRRRTLNAFYEGAKFWMMRILNIAPLDVKGLLQTYLSEYDDDGAYGHVALGRSFALEMGSAIPMADQRLGAIDRRKDECNINAGSDFIAQYTTRQEYKYADALPEYDQEWMKLLQLSNSESQSRNQLEHDVHDSESVLAVLERRVLEGKFIAIAELRDILRRAAALLCRSKQDQCAIVRYLVAIPFGILSKQSINLGISIWLSVINENPRMEPRILVEISRHWEKSIQTKKGIFNDKLSYLDPFYIKEEFAPSDKSVLSKRQQATHNLIVPHLRVLHFLSSHFNAYRLGSPHLRRSFQRLMTVTLDGLSTLSGHPLSREFHFHIILFGLSILKYSDDLGKLAKWRFKDRILSTALSWFTHPPRWSFGGNRLQIKAECQLLTDVEKALAAISDIGSTANSTLLSLSTKQELLAHLLESEHTRLQVWLFPMNHEQRHLFSSHRSDKAPLASVSPLSLRAAWAESPRLAIQIVSRAQSPSLLREVRSLILNNPKKVIDEPDALPLLLEDGLPRDVSSQLKYLLYWHPVNPITAATYFLPAYGNDPFITQYAMRALESHSVNVTFFYVPQIVQTLRYDTLGYVERYIIETAKFSQLFAHQIIWNMKANAYKDEDSTTEDPLKPTLDKVMENMIASFSATDKSFYEREFSFFNEITDISGKLRPFIKRSKPEKKQKIEEELRKIKVEVGVYLPSNPDGVVVGIDRKSGKPLQSHAKAPYMATFRIKKNKGDMEGTEDLLEATNQNNQASDSRRGLIPQDNTYEVWQSAIFKVGDDCRQDVLALQMIAAFRGIFNSIGLDVFVYPYRVTATAPGCGVIDVLPNSISRDMLGREAVNGLYDYFVSKYGGEDSIRFQEARSNFVKSMAAYSIISYLLQFKDRHNGNIMVDDAGHILHIDFGFCFDIAPGGVRFERAPFKLTSEMVAVMGGPAGTASQGYRWFEELCIKAFLASRPYTEKLCHLVVLMLDSGLPCFKPESITHFRERFVLEKSEREAADFVKDLIKKSHNSYSTIGYDQFQLLTNGIPY